MSSATTKKSSQTTKTKVLTT